MYSAKQSREFGIVWNKMREDIRRFGSEKKFHEAAVSFFDMIQTLKGKDGTLYVALLNKIERYEQKIGFRLAHEIKEYEDDLNKLKAIQAIALMFEEAYYEMEKLLKELEI